MLDRACLRATVLMVAISILGGAGMPVSASNPLATFQLGRGWATFGLALPRGAAHGGVGVGTLPTQTDVKTTWPDGSIRFAVVTARVPAPAAYAIAAAPTAPTPPPRNDQWPSASVEFVVDGETWLAELPRPLYAEWLAGPLVDETRAYVTPQRAGRGHPFLKVIFDARIYADRSTRLDITVENVVNLPAADQITYDVKIRGNGQTLFQQAQVEHPYLTRWRRTFSVNLEEADVTPDWAPFIAAGALPPYLPDVAAPPRTIDGPQFGILQTGDLTVPMNAHGGRPEIAPYPDWAAQYLVHKRPDQRAYLLRHGELAGSFAVHIKEGEGVRLISIDRQPNFWLDTRADADGRPLNGLRGAGIPGDNAHQPSLAFIPYLVTGDRFFLDEMKYWANFSLLWTFQDSYSKQRGGSQGLLAYNEVRGIGWALRNLADTAAYMPDRDNMRHYFRDKLSNNLRWLDEYQDSLQTPLGTLFPGRRPEDEHWSPYAWVALWEQTYLAWAVDRAQQHGFGPGAALRNRIARFQLRLFTSASEGFPPEYAGAYVLAVGIRDGAKVRYFETLSEVFHVTHKFGNARPFEGYYGPEARLMLLIALRGGWPGAEEAYQFLMRHVGEDGISMKADLERRAGWAIARPARK